MRLAEWVTSETRVSDTNMMSRQTLFQELVQMIKEEGLQVGPYVPQEASFSERQFYSNAFREGVIHVLNIITRASGEVNNSIQTFSTTPGGLPLEEWEDTPPEEKESGKPGAGSNPDSDK